MAQAGEGCNSVICLGGGDCLPAPPELNPDVGLNVDVDGKGNEEDRPEPSGNVLDIVNRLWALELALPVELFLLVAAVNLLVSVFFAYFSAFFFLSSVNNSPTYSIL